MSQKQAEAAQRHAAVNAQAASASEYTKVHAANERLRDENSELREEVEEMKAMIEVLKAQVRERQGLVDEGRRAGAVAVV